MTDAEFWAKWVVLPGFILTALWMLVSALTLQKRSLLEFPHYTEGSSHAPRVRAYRAIAVSLLLGGGAMMIRYMTAGAVMWAAGCLMIMARVLYVTRPLRKCPSCRHRMTGYRDAGAPAGVTRFFYVCNRCRKYFKGSYPSM